MSDRRKSEEGDEVDRMQRTGLLPVGQPVEVRQRVTERWSGGFEVVAVEPGPEPGVRVRRRSDGRVLPAVFPLSDCRPA